MSFVEGTSLEPLFDPDGERRPSRSWPSACATRRARWRRCTPSTPHAIGLGGEPVVGLDREIDRWCRLLETVDPALVPGWEESPRALRAEHARPPCPTPSCTATSGSATCSPIGADVTAVIDWEIWTVGDPRVDVGWFLANADPATYRAADPLRGRAAVAGRAASTSTPTRSVATYPTSTLVPGARLLQVGGDLVADRQAQPPPREPDPDLEAMAAVLPHLLGTRGQP